MDDATRALAARDAARPPRRRRTRGTAAVAAEGTVAAAHPTSQRPPRSGAIRGN